MALPNIAAAVEPNPAYLFSCSEVQPPLVLAPAADNHLAGPRYASAHVADDVPDESEVGEYATGERHLRPQLIDASLR